MKYRLAVVFALLSVQVFGQLTVYEQFQKIGTLDQAKQFVDANPNLKPTLLYLSAGKDSALIEKRLLRQNQGDIVPVGNITYKIIQAKDTVNLRARYIFLDGSTYSKSEIDSLKNLIVKKANEGVPFETLSDQYTMDGNETRGDTGWFFGEHMMPKEFQDAVQKNEVGQIFFLDVSKYQWHYIIKKTHENRVEKDIVVLRAQGR